MRLVLRALVVIAVALTAFTPATASADEAAALATDKEIRALYEKFTEAWNRHDTETMGNMWIAEGDVGIEIGSGVFATLLPFPFPLAEFWAVVDEMEQHEIRQIERGC